MIRIDVHHDVAPVEVEVAIELDVHNYNEIARKERGRFVGLLAAFGPVRAKVDAAIHDQVERSVVAGLNERVRPELIERLEESITKSLTDSLTEQLAENGVQADVRVTVAAR
jgi:hypothetical protein